MGGGLSSRRSSLNYQISGICIDGKSPGGEIYELKDDYASIKWLERLQLSKSYKQEAHKFSSKIAW